MSETLIGFIAGASLFGAGFCIGALNAAAYVYHQQTEWLRTSVLNLEKIVEETRADQINREDYHRSIVAWVRGKERT